MSQHYNNIVKSILDCLQDVTGKPEEDIKKILYERTVFSDKKMTAQNLRKIIDYISRNVPEDYVFMFAVSEATKAKPIINYASNCKRDQMIRALEQIIDSIETNMDFIQVFEEN